MKSPNWISGTGRRPYSAMPIAVPMMPASASGVSITRSAPNSSYRPLVARNTPPNLPTSSPSTTTRGSARIWVCSALRTASMMFMVGMRSLLRTLAGSGRVLRLEVGALLAQVPRHVLVDVVEQGPDRRRRHELRGVRGGLDLAVVALGQLGLPALAPQPEMAQVAAQAVQRILRGRVLPDLEDDGNHVERRGPVRRVRVAVDHGGQRLDQRRAVAGPRALDRLAGDLPHRERIVAVDPHARHAVADRLGRERPRRGLRGLCATRPAAVAAHEHAGRLPHRGEVHADVE